LKKVEIESLLKSFALFFSSQFLLVFALFYMDYTKSVGTLDEDIFSDMRICSFDLYCEGYEIDFEDANLHELYKLYKDDKELSAYFSISQSTKNILKIYLPHEKYERQLQEIKKHLVLKFTFVLFIIILLSIVFSIYTLSPLRNALNLTQEFIKDILHDFNTPIATLRLNISMLSKEIGDNSKVRRIENSIQNILSLQSNLRSYLFNHEKQVDTFSLVELLQERVGILQSHYPTIQYGVNVSPCSVTTNKEAFTRIIDNLLTNASKYNKHHGVVELLYNDKVLEIRDTGKGIQNPSKVFDRFYKEQERGIGIGLHIVKKLCEELHIFISLESKTGIGTSFYLHFHKIATKK